MADPSAVQIQAGKRKARGFILEACTAYTISEQQSRILINPPIPPSLGLSRAQFPAPLDEPNGCRDLLRDAIVSLDEGKPVVHVPLVREVPVEWSAYQPELATRQREITTESEAYQYLTRACEDDLTIMFIHGGIFYTNTPASRRIITRHLSKVAKCKCVSPQYRLAPQHPFPAALLDILVSYLTLLHPTPGSFHAPIKPSSVVLAGDSSGACLALALIQVILHTQNPDNKPAGSVRFHGRDVPLVLPAGVACLSAALDQTLSLPSYAAGAHTDLVPPDHPSSAPNFPTCNLWPTSPPREHLYAAGSLLSHPLVSPATAHNWKGAPPLWFASGEEALADGAKTVAAAAKRQGVKVGWSEWEMMPHVWSLGFAKWWQTEDVVNKWGSVCGQMGRSGTFEGQDSITGTDKKIREVNVGTFTGITPLSARAIMLDKVQTMRPYLGTQKDNSRL